MRPQPKRSRRSYAPASSHRKDGRGHWPPGKRRSDIAPLERRTVIVRIRAAIERGESRKSIARLLHMSDRTIRRWLAREDWPTAASAKRVRALPRPRVT